MAQERLDRVLSHTGKWSRREIRELIRRGQVRADGVTVTRPEEKIDPERVKLQVCGEQVSWEAFLYVMMHKPAGVLSATEDGREETVLDLLPDWLRRRGLFPAGRLDRDTTGLLLLTDDGPLAHALLSPRHHVDKVYLARVAGRVDEGDVKALREGMVLGDGLVCLPAGLEILGDGSCCLVTLQEGKYHQVKRMLAQRGKPVLALKRLSMGPLELDGDLQPGQWRFLTGQETERLRCAVNVP